MKATTPASDPLPISASLEAVGHDVDAALLRFLDDRGAELAGMAPQATDLVDEIRRLVRAGGKRIRPSLCIWAHRAAGGTEVESIVRAAAALELLHTFALVHDDVMDDASTRRGVETTQVRFASRAPDGTDARAYGTSIAILVGDLAAVLAERMLRTCGAEPEPLAVALGRFDRMRIEMAAGQFLDLEAPAGPSPARVAALKTGSYTAEGPVLIGCALAEAGPAVEGPLTVFARHLGEAFQLRDDVVDGDASAAEHVSRVDALVDRATDALIGAPLETEAAQALVAIASLVRMGSA